MRNSAVKLAVKFVSFVLVTLFCVGAVNECLKPKYYYNQMWPSTNTYLDFYALEKNSVDVLFLGSSHAMCAFNPQVIYDTYGITSYNLGSEQQSLVVSYYWLREALKYQSPRAVVLDTYILHKFGANYVYNDLNSSESSVRKAMDSMRLSPLKWEAAQTIERIDPTQSALSYIFLNIRYHTRWSLLDEDDYTEGSMIAHGGVKGFTTTGGGSTESTYVPFQDSDADSVEAESMFDTSQEYLDKIVALCAEKNIQLILTNIPCGESIERYKSTRDYAAAHGLPYYDFNEMTLYNAIHYNDGEDLLSHPNYRGAEKISLYLGSLLATEYGVPSREDASYDQSRAVYNHALANIDLTLTTDPCDYLDKLGRDGYTLFLFAPKSYSAYMSDAIMERLFALGFQADLRSVSEGNHYCAVRDAGQITEQIDWQDFSFSGSVRDGLTPYSFCIDTSIMVPSGQTFSMLIGGTECGNQSDGLDIAVYDTELKTIIDRVNINTNDPALPLTHY